jgi:hypothetical protein
MKIKGVYSFLIFSCLTGSIFGQGTTFDVEYAQICLIDSIAPDTVVQFWRFTQANNPGEYQVDRTFDLSATYSPTGTVLPCCSCLTEATAMDGAGFGGGGSIGDIAFSNPAPINALLCFSFLVALVLYFPRRKIFAALLVASPLALSAQPGTVYDVEYTCICLVDSIAADTITQFWRFTQANNPGEFEVDLTFDLSATYSPSGEIIGCKDYYLGDNPGGSGTAGTLAIWTGAHSLGNSNVTESAQILSSSFTGAFKPPAGTTAQQPAGSPGYLRFNTTQSGFEGYNGSAYRFLPWADADNFTSTRIPFSDGNQFTSSDLVKWDNANGIFQIGIVKTGDTPYTIDILPPVTSGTQTNISIGTTYNHGGSGFNVTSGVAIGVNSRLTSTSNGNATAIGANAQSAGNSTAVGENAVASGEFSIAIGRNSLASQSGTTAVGHGAQATAVNKPVAVGQTAVVSGQWAIALGSEITLSGNRSIVIGANTTVTNTDGLGIGKDVKLTANEQAVFSSFNASSNGYTDVYFGSGVQRNAISDGAGVAWTLNGSGARGSNGAGGPITIAGGKGTGTGAPGDVVFSTSDAGASGSTLQTLTQRVWIKGETGQVGIGVSSPNAAALLQMDSTTQGFLPPRMTTAQRDAITAVQGLVIFNTTTTKLECYDGATWQAAW